MINQTIAIILAAIATEALVEIAINGQIFDVIGLRPMLAKKATCPGPPFYAVFLFKLSTCGYCLSVWVALAVAMVAVDGGYAELIIKAFVIHRLSNFWHVVFELVKRGRVKTADINVTLIDKPPQLDPRLDPGTMWPEQSPEQLSDK